MQYLEHNKHLTLAMNRSACKGAGVQICRTCRRISSRKAFIRDTTEAQCNLNSEVREAQATDLEPLACPLGSLAFGLLLNSKLRRRCSQLLNSVHNSLFQEVLAEDAWQLVHQYLCQLQCLGNNGAVLLGQQTSNETGDGQITKHLP